jgi:hypothetical protein
MKDTLVAKRAMTSVQPWSRFDETVPAVIYRQNLIGVKYKGIKCGFYVQLKSKIFVNNYPMLLSTITYSKSLFFDAYWSLNEGWKFVRKLFVRNVDSSNRHQVAQGVDVEVIGQHPQQTEQDAAAQEFSWK